MHKKASVHASRLYTSPMLDRANRVPDDAEPLAHALQLLGRALQPDLDLAEEQAPQQAHVVIVVALDEGFGDGRGGGHGLHGEDGFGGGEGVLTRPGAQVVGGVNGGGVGVGEALVEELASSLGEASARTKVIDGAMRTLRHRPTTRSAREVECDAWSMYF